MKIYFDTCGLQRPLDSKTQIRIALEAEAVLVILTLAEADKIEMIASEALVFEVEQNPFISVLVTINFSIGRKLLMILKRRQFRLLN